MGHAHPESPARLDAVKDALRGRGLLARMVDTEAPKATTEQLARAHSVRHVETIHGLTPVIGFTPIDPDTRLGPGTWDAALRAAGAVVRATDLVLDGAADRAFCCVRPPGHHAERERATGFCFFNNVAVGALHALRARGLGRVAVVDFDAHFANGTADILGDEPNALLCSIYEHPLYPGLDPPSRPGLEVNCPLARGSGPEEVRRAIEDHWIPALDKFAPELLYISAGFDAVDADPLTGLRLAPGDYAWITRTLVGVAERHAGGRVVSVLEGGYDLATLGEAAAEHVAALLGDGAA